MEHPEGRETEDAEQQGAEAEHAGLADTVGDIAPEGEKKDMTTEAIMTTARAEERSSPRVWVR